MVTPELRSWDCTDHHPIDRWSPEGDEVLYWLVLGIGEPGSTAADLYTVPVATMAGLKTPDWKQRTRSREWKRIRPIVLRHYSWDAVIGCVRDRIRACSGYTWRDAQDKLRREFHWEYEGMPAGPGFDSGRKRSKHR